MNKLFVNGPAHGILIYTEAPVYRIPVRLSRPFGIDPDPEPWKTNPFPSPCGPTYAEVEYRDANVACSLLSDGEPGYAPYNKNAWLVYLMTPDGHAAPEERVLDALIRVVGKRVAFD